MYAKARLAAANLVSRWRVRTNRGACRLIATQVAIQTARQEKCEELKRIFTRKSHQANKKPKPSATGYLFSLFIDQASFSDYILLAASLLISQGNFYAEGLTEAKFLSD